MQARRLGGDAWLSVVEPPGRDPGMVRVSVSIPRTIEMSSGE
jgi:hypothetical protein